MGVFDLVGTTASGWLSDRWDNRWLLIWYYGLRGAALLYSIVFGWIVAAHQIGAGLGALGAGVVRTELSTYTPAWVTAGLISMVAAVMVLGIGAVRAASPRPYGPTNATPRPRRIGAVER